MQFRSFLLTSRPWFRSIKDPHPRSSNLDTVESHTIFHIIIRQVRSSAPFSPNRYIDIAAAVSGISCHAAGDRQAIVISAYRSADGDRRIVKVSLHSSHAPLVVKARPAAGILFRLVTLSVFCRSRLQHAAVLPTATGMSRVE